MAPEEGSVVEGQVVVIGDAATSDTAANGWPPGAVWSLWIVVVAALVVSLAEWPKRLWFKPTKVWKSARKRHQKVGLMAPLLVVLGAGIGGPLFHAAGMLNTWLLCFALGAGVGILSAPLYDSTLGVIALIPKIVKKRLTEDETDGGEDDDEYVPHD